ncbi:MAG TPA: HD domain-containing protein [Actinophytocola sp.]|uniref:HD domain-containing protein n=1 Tax=Actinophytocola sp. TaxID=1872138 RepID=UPI002F95CC4D
MTLWAWALAERHLARELPRRWAHVQGVARLGSRVGREILAAVDHDVLVAAALLHDIGYAATLVDTGYHPLDGARFLAGEHHEPHLARLVANHSAARFVAEIRGLGDELSAFPDERTALRDALWYSDMRISPGGEPVTFDERIAEIRVRHGSGSVLVRALDAGALDARWDAVRRTEQRLAEAAAVRERV